MSTRTCGLNLMPEIIFPKKELQMRDFESFISWFKFRFMGDCVLDSLFFLKKISWSVNHSVRHSYYAPKKRHLE